jgi:hypothetical protein
MGPMDQPASFDSTPQFAQFREQMRKLLTVPKTRVDELVQQAKESSPRRNNPSAPGRKRVKRSRRPKR